MVRRIAWESSRKPPASASIPVQPSQYRLSPSTAGAKLALLMFSRWPDTPTHNWGTCSVLRWSRSKLLRDLHRQEELAAVEGE